MRKKIIAKTAAFLMAASMTAALVSCGSNDSSKTSGTVSMGTADTVKTTASAAETVPAETEPAGESKAEESKPEESKAEESKPEESTAESSPADDRQPEVAADASFKERMSIKLNDAVIYPGDKFADIKDKLGKEAKPSSKAKPCVPGAQEVEYFYYPGVTVQVNFEGTIISIAVSEESVPGQDGTTAGGLRLGDTRETAKKFLGKPDQEDEYQLAYNEGSVAVRIYDRENGGIFLISVEDMDLPF